MRFHWQNLNERRRGADGDTPTGTPWHGRAWLHFEHHEAHAEWVIGSVATHLGVKFGDEGILFSFALPLLSLYVGLNGPRFWRDYRKGQKEIRLSVHDWALWWNFWTDPYSWRSSTPRYRNGSFHVLDFLLGKHRHSERDLAWRWVSVPMPERSYYGAARLFESTWRRPRWFPKRLVRVEIKMLDGERVPHPGKGENSWDCGEDGTYGITCAAGTIDAGVGELVKSTLEQRSRYGGHEWRPESGGALAVQP